MTNLYKLYKTDPVLEREGVDFRFDDAILRIARAGGANTKFVRALAEKTKHLRRAIELDALDDSEGTQILREVFVDTILVGWEGVKDEEGNPLEFTRDNAIKLLTDLPDLMKDLQQFASSIANYRRERVNDAIKN